MKRKILYHLEIFDVDLIAGGWIRMDYDFLEIQGFVF